MSNPRPTSGSGSGNVVEELVDELVDNPITLMVVLIGAMVAVPALLAAFWTKAIAWALQHAVLVPAAEASLTIPSTQAGLDGRRIVAGALLVIAVSAAVVSLGRQKRLRDAQIRARRNTR